MKTLLTFTIFITAFSVISQDDSFRNARTVRFYAGLPTQQSGTSDKWHDPTIELGLDLHHSIRLSKQFFLSAGLGINYCRFRTDPFYRTWTTYTFVPGVGQVPEIHSEDFDRQTRATYLAMRFPLQVEYMPQGKWKPYAKAGFLFDALLYDRSLDVYAHTDTRAPLPPDVGQPMIDGHDQLLSATLSGGVKYRFEAIEFLLGLTSQVGLTAFNRYDEVSRLTIGTEFSIRKTIKNGIIPNKVGTEEEGAKMPSTKYVYLDVLGLGAIVSLNYERTLIRKNNHRINSRVGFGVIPSDENTFTLPIGVSWIWGKRHGFELGCEALPVVSDFSASMLAPHVGYRAEIFKGLLLRVNGNVMVFDDNYARFLPSVSIGKFF